MEVPLATSGQWHLKGKTKKAYQIIFFFIKRLIAHRKVIYSPEQQLLSNSEFNTRLNNLSWFFVAGQPQP